MKKFSLLFLLIVFSVGCEENKTKPKPERNYTFQVRYVTSNGQLELIAITFGKDEFFIDSSKNAIHFCNELNNLEKNIRNNLENFKVPENHTNIVKG